MLLVCIWKSFETFAVYHGCEAWLILEITWWILWIGLPLATPVLNFTLLMSLPAIFLHLQQIMPILLVKVNTTLKFYWNALFIFLFTVISLLQHIILAPCKTSTFQMGVKSFRKKSVMTFKKGTDNRNILISYSKNIVTAMTTSKLVDLATFISSIGGNLGLFVGFSLINSLFFLFEQAEKLMKRNKK